MKKKMKPIVNTNKNPANGLLVVVSNHIEGESRVVNATDENKSNRRRRHRRRETVSMDEQNR
jgi:hypothetical protein